MTSFVLACRLLSEFISFQSAIHKTVSLNCYCCYFCFSCSVPCLSSCFNLCLFVVPCIARNCTRGVRVLASAREFCGHSTGRSSGRTAGLGRTGGDLRGAHLVMLPSPLTPIWAPSTRPRPRAFLSPLGRMGVFLKGPH